MQDKATVQNKMSAWLWLNTENGHAGMLNSDQNRESFH